MMMKYHATHLHLDLMQHCLFLHMHIIHIILMGSVVKGHRILEHPQDVLL